MKPNDNIEKTIKKFDIEINSKADDTIRKELLQAQANSKGQRSVSNKPSIAAIILKSRIIIPTTAVIVLVSIAGVMFLPPQYPVEPNESSVIEGAGMTNEMGTTNSDEDNPRGTRATMGISPVDRRRMIPVDRQRIEDEKLVINEMANVGDIDGLVEKLENWRMYECQVLAAEYLGEIGDDRALPMLAKINKDRGGWMFGDKYVSTYGEGHSRYGGVFAEAMGNIITRDLSSEEQIEVWFDVLEGEGPIAPVVDKLIDVNGAGVIWRPKDGDLAVLFPDAKLKCGLDIGKRIGAKLSEFDDPSITARLREIDNKGSATYAVWMEVRDMETEEAIERCKEIARNEPGAQRYGAIHCLSEKYGTAAIAALDELALEGYVEAIVAFDDYNYNTNVLKILCWHLTDNKSAQVRLKVILPKLFKSVHAWREKQPEFISAMVTALYDPNKDIRQRAAMSLRRIANSSNKSLVAEFEEDLLFALQHPDEEIRPFILQALKNLGSDRIDEPMPQGLSIRTDLNE